MNKPHNIAYIAVFLVIISVIIYLNLVYQENLKKDISMQFNRQQVILAKSAALSIEKQIDHYVKYLVTVSRFPNINEVEKSFIREQVIHAIMADLPQHDPTVIDFQILDRNGVVRLDSSSPETVGADLSGRGYFLGARQLIKGEVYISQMLHIAELNPAKRYIVFATPLFSAAGRGAGAFDGVALFAISVDDIAGACVSQIRLGEKGYGWVMDSTGTLVYHPEQPEMIGKNLLKADASCFSCHKSFDTEKKMLEGIPTEYGMYTAPLGEDKLIAYSRAKVGPESWLVCVTVPYSEVTGLIARSMRLYSMLISIIFFSVIATSVFFVVLIKKKTAADEKAKYAAELEDKVVERTRELSQEKEKMKAILSGLGAGVSLLDREYNILWANEVISRLVGEPMGKCYALYMNKNTPCEGCPLPAALAGGKVGQTESVCRRDARHGEASPTLLAAMTDEPVGHFQIVLAPMKGADGRAAYAVELIQDITATRMLEERMMHSEKLASLGRLSAGIAHEIGNPLTAVSSFIQILQEKSYEDDFTNGALDTVSFHISRIKGILQQMSGMSRSYQTEKAPVDINEVVKASLDLLEFEKGMKNCELKAAYYPERLIVEADEKWLVSVFVNLLLNAVDAMPGKGRLTVRVDRDGLPGMVMAVVEITDTGVGIPPEDLGRIFDPFFTTKQTGKGTGLGLAVSYNIVKDLKGDITVSSQVGEGTTFTVRIPSA